MKMLTIIGPHGREEEIRALLDRHAARAFTQIPGVLGEGAKGRHLDTPVWPGREALFFTVVEDDRLPSLAAALRELSTQLYPDEGLRAFVLPAEQVL